MSLGKEKFYITDSRYEIDAKLNAKNCKVVISKDILQQTINIINKYKLKKIYFDPYDLNSATYLKLQSNTKINLVQQPHFSISKRIIKNDNEIILLEKASQKASKGFDKLYKYFQDKQINEIELNYQCKKILTQKDKYKTSFDPITAIDQNSAKPHATPTKTMLSSNSLVLIDAGIKYNQYCSDKTRTYIDQSNKLQNKIYNIVQKAHDKAISSIKVGMKASKIDKIARDIINDAGYGQYFIHSTGHGVGLDIHEYPIISQKSDTIIEENMIFTIEPGIYLENQFGIRIEDTIKIKNGKAVVLK